MIKPRPRPIKNCSKCQNRASFIFRNEYLCFDDFLRSLLTVDNLFSFEAICINPALFSEIDRLSRRIVNVLHALKAWGIENEVDPAEVFSHCSVCENPGLIFDQSTGKLFCKRHKQGTILL